MAPFLDGSEDISISDLWAMSRFARSVLGVHLFGFSDSGELVEYNYFIDNRQNDIDTFFLKSLFVILETADTVNTAKNDVVKYFTEHNYAQERDLHSHRRNRELVHIGEYLMLGTALSRPSSGRVEPRNARREWGEV